MATPYAWLGVFGYSVFGILLSLYEQSQATASNQVLVGLGFGLLLYLTNACHSLGHVIAARIVRAPMEVLLVTATRDVTLYCKDTPGPSRWKYVGRSLGGPITNLLVGAVSLAAWQLFRSDWWFFFSVFNLAIGAWTLCPVPSMDGWVIWGELFGFRKR
jgi:hypothetical protein